MTAEEFLKKQEYWNIDRLAKWEVKKAMIEFAKYHVEKALDSVYLKINIEKVIDGNKDSIINSYPLKNIK